MTPFRRYASDDRVVEQVQDSLEATFAPILNCSLIDGRKVGPVAFLSGSATRVSHGLGRRPQGFMCVDKDAPADFYRTKSTSPDLQLVLTATANVTAWFWIF